MNKLRILLPLFKGLGLRPNLRQLVLAQAGLESFIQGDIQFNSIQFNSRLTHRSQKKSLMVTLPHNTCKGAH